MIGAVDIGGTKIAVAAVHSDGRVAARAEWPTPALTADASVARMMVELAHCSQQAGLPLRGIGVGCTGPVDPLSGTIGKVDLLPGWHGMPLAQQLSRRLNLPVALENDADAAALAEAAWGAGCSATRFLYVTISTGIGAGFIVDGKLYRGAGGAHPEAGHHVIDPAGPLCYCGARGCWESLASGPAMVQWFRAHAAGRTLPETLSARDICDLARDGSDLAIQAVAREADYLGTGLANLATLFCPDVIALGGGLMQSADLFLDRALDIVRHRCQWLSSQEVVITPAALGDDVALRGAAAVWLSRFSEAELEISAT